MNSCQNKIVNLYLNDKLEGDFFVENTDVTNALTEVNGNEDDWLRHKSTIDSVESGYLNDLNFLSTKDSDMCTSDIGLDFILVDGKKELNLNNCSMTDKNSDLDTADPFLNLIPLNELLLRKPDTKADKLVNMKNADVSDTDISNKCRPVWDTVNIVNRRSYPELESNSDYYDLNLLPFSFETTDHNSNVESATESVLKNNAANSFLFKSLKNEKSNPSFGTESCNSNMFSNLLDIKDSAVNTTKAKSINKQANRLKLSSLKSSGSDSLVAGNMPFNENKNLNFNMSNKCYSNRADTITDVTDTGAIQVVDFSFRILPECASSSAVPNELESTPNEEKKKSLRKDRISAINNMTGSVAIVSNSTINSKPQTKIVIKTNEGDENYEGNTADLMETMNTDRKSGRSHTPIEGEHIVTSVKTAASIIEEKKHDNSKTQEPEDGLVKEMLNALGITDDLLYSMVTNLGLRMWVCPELACKRIFSRLNTLKSHILSHYGLKPFKCDFPGCPWSFYTSFKLKRHRETHLKRKDFTCTVPDCNRTFTTIYNLNTHLKLHERPARLKCLVLTCNSRFQTRRAMETHLKTHDMSLAPYKCTHPGCDKLYFSYSALIAHSRSHQHKEEELRCQWENCGRLFDKPCRLKAHMRQHTGDKPYVCRFKDCKWAFPSASKLKRHQYKHNNERKFRCTIGDCTKAFMRSEHLREHTFTHIAQKTFQCPICGEKCSAKATLYVHKKKFHPNERKKKINNTESIILPTEQTESNQTIEKCDENETINLPTIDLPESNNENDNISQQAFLLAILSNEKHDQSAITEDSEPVSLTDITSKEYKLNVSDLTAENHVLAIPSQIENINANKLLDPDLTKKERQTLLRKSKIKKKCDVIRSCARTYLPYENVFKHNEIFLSNSPPTLSTIEKVFEEYSDESSVPDVASSEVILGTNLVSNADDTICLNNYIMQEDDKPDSNNAEDKAEYILLLNSEGNAAFPQSTINLKDLD